MNAPWPDSRPRGRKGSRKFAPSKAQVRLAQAAMVHRDTSQGPCSAANLGIKQGELREQGEKVLAS